MNITVVPGFLPRADDWSSIHEVRDLVGVSLPADEADEVREELQEFYIEHYSSVTQDRVHRGTNVPAFNVAEEEPALLEGVDFASCRIFLGDAVTFRDCTFSKGTEFLVPYGFYRGMYFTALFEKCKFSGPVYFVVEDEDAMQYGLFRDCSLEEADFSAHQFWTGVKVVDGVQTLSLPASLETAEVLWRPNWVFAGCKVDGASRLKGRDGWVSFTDLSAG